jgi:hypothetical protein
MIKITQWTKEIEKNMRFGSNVLFKAISVMFGMVSNWSLRFFNTIRLVLEFQERL